MEEVCPGQMGSLNLEDVSLVVGAFVRDKRDRVPQVIRWFASTLLVLQDSLALDLTAVVVAPSCWA